MKRNIFPLIGIALYLIVTFVDMFVLSLPMLMYIAVLITGSMLVMSMFFEDVPHFRAPHKSVHRHQR